jgi:hypothetical protein
MSIVKLTNPPAGRRWGETGEVMSVYPDGTLRLKIRGTVQEMVVLRVSAWNVQPVCLRTLLLSPSFTRLEHRTQFD